VDIAELSRRTKEQDVQVEEDAEEHDDHDDVMLRMMMKKSKTPPMRLSS